MEGAPNDRTSADPPMTPIERQMQIIATNIKDLARETSHQNQELWQAIKKGPPTHLTTTNPLRGEKTGRTTKKLTTVKSHAARQTRQRKPHPRTDIERKVQEALPIPAGRGWLEPHDRPSSQNDQTSRPNSLNDQTSRLKSQNNMNGRPSSLNDPLGPPNNRTIRPDNPIA